jgi:hypothetical protein
MEPGNPQNPMGILHKDGMRYDVATGRNLGPDVLPRPSGGGGGGGGYAPRSTYGSGGGGGSRGLPAPTKPKVVPHGTVFPGGVGNMPPAQRANPFAPPAGGWFNNGVNALEQELAMLNPHKKFTGHL